MNSDFNLKNLWGGVEAINIAEFQKKKTISAAIDSRGFAQFTHVTAVFDGKINNVL